MCEFPTRHICRWVTLAFESVPTLNYAVGAGLRGSSVRQERKISTKISESQEFGFGPCLGRRAVWGAARREFVGPDGITLCSSFERYSPVVGICIAIFTFAA